jgi:hypothetical protein
MDPINDIYSRQDAGPPVKEDAPKVVKITVTFETIKKIFRWIKEMVKYAWENEICHVWGMGIFVTSYQGTHFKCRARN